jgi:hypothetical protein
MIQLLAAGIDHRPVGKKSNKPQSQKTTPIDQKPHIKKPLEPSPLRTATTSNGSGSNQSGEGPVNPSSLGVGDAGSAKNGVSNGSQGPAGPSPTQPTAEIGSQVVEGQGKPVTLGMGFGSRS